MLAYFDSFAGLIPCRILAVGDWRDSSSIAKLELLGRRGAYRRGQIIETVLGRAIPRSAAIRRGGLLKVKPYSWLEELERRPYSD